MEIWAKYSESITFCCPIWEDDRKLLVDKIPFLIQKPIQLYEFDLKSLKNALKSVLKSFQNLWILYKAIKSAEHIHFRCPGNIGLLGAIVQIVFPNKKKTVKYAGNFDPKSNQPWSYKLQKRILSNTFLCKNCKVLVYGVWKNQTKNIKPFFTASYSEAEKEVVPNRDLKKEIKIVFVGTLSLGKRPLYAIQMVENLVKNGNSTQLTIFGEGKERQVLENYISNNNLEKHIFFKGNQPSQIVKKAYQESHFVILPSQSEGWPKVVAEAMFWGCIPISSKVSCVPFMLDYGKRGVLLDFDLLTDSDQILRLIDNEALYSEMSQKGTSWSRKYTLDYFEQEIKLLLQS
jgi:glycosyltransferase involved in cell wall biosynthesis